MVALGVDSSPRAVAEARARGAIALCRSVFDPLPGEGRWGSVVLLDGNVGIGGDPVALLARARRLMAPGGVALVEVEPPGRPSQRLRVRLETGGVQARGSRGRGCRPATSARWWRRRGWRLPRS